MVSNLKSEESDAGEKINGRFEVEQSLAF